MKNEIKISVLRIIGILLSTELFANGPSMYSWNKRGAATGLK